MSDINRKVPVQSDVPGRFGNDWTSYRENHFSLVIKPVCGICIFCLCFKSSDCLAAVFMSL